MPSWQRREDTCHEALLKVNLRMAMQLNNLALLVFAAPNVIATQTTTHCHARL